MKKKGQLKMHFLMMDFNFSDVKKINLSALFQKDRIQRKTLE